MRNMPSFANPFSKTPASVKSSDAVFFEKILGKEQRDVFEEMVGKVPSSEDLKESMEVRLSVEELGNLADDEAERRKQSFKLSRIPEWDKLPEVSVFETDFKLDPTKKIYSKNRSMHDFVLTEKDLQETSLPQLKALAIIEAIDRDVEVKKIPLFAEIFDLEEVLQRKKSLDPTSRDSLTTAEVYQAIDDAGFRPARLVELLAFAKDHWIPDFDPEMSSVSDEVLIRREGAPYLIALGSLVIDDHSDKMLSLLSWDGQTRRLAENLFHNAWEVQDHFLVIRK